MKTITLDFTECRYLGEIHQVLKEAFGFPDYYGENWDALWDCLRYYSDELMLVQIKGLHTLPQELHAQTGVMVQIFKDVHNALPNIVFDEETA